MKNFDRAVARAEESLTEFQDNPDVTFSAAICYALRATMDVNQHTIDSRLSDIARAEDLFRACCALYDSMQIPPDRTYKASAERISRAVEVRKQLLEAKERWGRGERYP